MYAVLDMCVHDTAYQASCQAVCVCPTDWVSLSAKPVPDDHYRMCRVGVRVHMELLYSSVALADSHQKQ